MDFKKAISEIKVLLGMETSEEPIVVNMVTGKLKDSETVIEYENLEVGTILYVVTDETTKTPAPEGTHELEDGTKVTVDAEGKITEVVPAVEEETKVEEVKEEETEEVKAKKEFLSKFMSEGGNEIQDQLNWLANYIFTLESKVWGLESSVNKMTEMELKLAKIEGAVGAMFGQFEAMEPMVTEFSTLKGKVETIESTPAGKSIFAKEVKEDEKVLTLAEQRVAAIKSLKK